MGICPERGQDTHGFLTLPDKARHERTLRDEQNQRAAQNRGPEERDQNYQQQPPVYYDQQIQYDGQPEQYEPPQDPVDQSAFFGWEDSNNEHPVSQVNVVYAPQQHGGSDDPNPYSSEIWGSPKPEADSYGYYGAYYNQQTY